MLFRRNRLQTLPQNRQNLFVTLALEMELDDRQETVDVSGTHDLSQKLHAEFFLISREPDLGFLHRDSRIVRQGRIFQQPQGSSVTALLELRFRAEEHTLQRYALVVGCL